MRLEDIRNIHFLGIGGIGMSALARYMHLQGKVVTGYDRTATPVTEDLEKLGIALNFEPDPSKLEHADLLIFTPAVQVTHPEYLRAQELGVPILKRAQVLGLISQAYRTVGVAGTHGKTSTTGLTTHLLRCAGVDVTGFIGGITRNYDSNFVHGESDWVVVEADEFDRSFLQLSPEVAVITSMDADHLDIYGEADFVTESFRAYAERLGKNGTLFLQERLKNILGEVSPEVVTYGIGAGEARADNLRVEGLNSFFDYSGPDGSLPDVEFRLPGTYNVENATAAISVALKLGGDPEGIREGLKSFKGIRRRFDVRFNGGDIVYIDDYAHHPEEIRAVLTAVRQMLPTHKVVAAFQPHLFSRTRDFYPGFAEALSAADGVVLLDIYPAREAPMQGISSELIFDRLTCPEKTLTGLEGMVGALQTMRAEKMVVMTIGAGNIDTKIKATEDWVAGLK